MTSIKKVLATNVTNLRLAHKMTLEELGTAIGTSRQFIWNLENEKTWISLSKVERLSKVFNIPEYKLFQFDNK